MVSAHSWWFCHFVGPLGHAGISKQCSKICSAIIDHYNFQLITILNNRILPISIIPHSSSWSVVYLLLLRKTFVKLSDNLCNPYDIRYLWMVSNKPDEQNTITWKTDCLCGNRKFYNIVVGWYHYRFFQWYIYCIVENQFQLFPKKWLKSGIMRIFDKYTV